MYSRSDPRLWLMACIVTVLGPVTFSHADAQSTDWERLQAVYEYDQALPPVVEVSETAGNNFYTTYSLTIEAVDGSQIPAILHRPNRPEPVPCVLLMHGLGGDKDSYALPMAMAMAPMGIAVMAIDARLHGERAREGEQMLSANLQRARDAIINTIIDNRRALDYLDSRDDIAHDRYMLIGMSMGGIQGAVLAAVDQRIKSVALVVAGGRLDALFLASEHPAAQALRDAGFEGEMLSQALYDLEPVNFIGHVAPRPLLLINGTQDEIIPAANAETLHQAAAEPKQIIWYEGGHIPPVGQLLVQLLSFAEANLHN